MGPTKTYAASAASAAQSLSGGAIAGIIIGVLAGLLLCLLVSTHFTVLLNSIFSPIFVRFYFDDDHPISSSFLFSLLIPFSSASSSLLSQCFTGISV